jgi:hypothetical protein
MRSVRSTIQAHIMKPLVLKYYRNLICSTTKAKIQSLQHSYSYKHDQKREKGEVLKRSEPMLFVSRNNR